MIRKKILPLNRRKQLLPDLCLWREIRNIRWGLVLHDIKKIRQKIEERAWEEYQRANDADDTVLINWDVD